MAYDLTSAMKLAWARYRERYAQFNPNGVSRKAFAVCLKAVHAELRFSAFYDANPDRFTLDRDALKLRSQGSNQRLRAHQGGWNDVR